jgi:hypothetical protein
MNDNDSPSDSSPPEFTIQVLRHKPNAQTRVLEPWPMATINITQAGTVCFSGDASKSYGPMQQAFEATVTAFAQAAAKIIERQIIVKADKTL